jgi:hypothetical protein
MPLDFFEKAVAVEVQLALGNAAIEQLPLRLLRRQQDGIALLVEVPKDVAILQNPISLEHLNPQQT